jgi:transaldolase
MMSSEKSRLRLYIDSAEKQDWEAFLPTGLFYGVATNPKLLRKAGLAFEVDHLADLANSAFKLGAMEIHLQVWGREVGKMQEVGKGLADIDSSVMVKVPITPAGVLCANELIAEGCNVTLTALHSAS